MATQKRTEKLQNLLREEISEILAEDIEFPEGFLVTLTKSFISRDLHYADVFVSCLRTDSEQNLTEADDAKTISEILEILRKNIYHIQQRLNRKLRIRPVPRIRFLLDSDEVKRIS